MENRLESGGNGDKGPSLETSHSKKDSDKICVIAVGMKRRDGLGSVQKRYPPALKTHPLGLGGKDHYRNDGNRV